jgi:tetratricopeptide (TPR) repeat protein
MQEVFAAVSSGAAETALRAAERAKGAAPHAPSVREALGLILYEMGDYKRALGELQAFRRMTGERSHDPRIADCYRALGRPERAVELLEDLDRTTVDEEVWIDALVVRAEATSETGNHPGAVAVLSLGPLDATEIHDRHRRLWYAYADMLSRAGRAEESRTWFRRLAVEAPDFADAVERAKD